MRFHKEIVARHGLMLVIFALFAGKVAASQPEIAAAQPLFDYRAVMVPMRDGAKLKTVILTPKNTLRPLPLLLQRTPYGVPDTAPGSIDKDLTDLHRDGYILVFQSVRGRFGSEGQFTMSTRIDRGKTSQVTDAYDTIDWLVRNVAGNNGRVGIWGVSYNGLTAAMTLIEPHPALKAVSEQAAPADWWMNDDMNHYGAFRLSYAFEYGILTQYDAQKNNFPSFVPRDTYKWYLEKQPLSLLDRVAEGKTSYWSELRAHPNYDAYWQGEAWTRHIRGSRVPTLHVAGFWDPEDPWGPWEIYRAAERADPNGWNQIVAGPWNHGGWREKGDRLGPLSFDGVATGDEYRKNVEAAFFRYWLHGRGDRPMWEVKTFQTGTNRWQEYKAWPPAGFAAHKLYLHSSGALSFVPPDACGAAMREYVSDPRQPVPYRKRPISPHFPGGDWPDWETDDQRFVDGRPDVLTYVSGPLTTDMQMTGNLQAEIFASSTATDSDIILKLIDVYPDGAPSGATMTVKTDDGWPSGPKPGEFGQSLDGYQLPIAMEVRRGRFLDSSSNPAPLPAGKVKRWTFPLRDRDHVFRKGHRIMVQIQSTWFPLIDANPQTFVADPREVKLDDYRLARLSIYSSPVFASSISLPLVQHSGAAVGKSRAALQGCPTPNLRH